MTAELVKVSRGIVVLRRADGKEVTVPLERLCDTDRTFVEQWLGNSDLLDRNAAGKVLRQIAERFYNDLRNWDRQVAQQTLTKKAQTLLTDRRSPLADLPVPESSRRAIRVGKVQLDGKLAEIPVLVRAGGALHKTKLHLRYEEDQWAVFALSATYPEGEKSIDFEAEGAPPQHANPLQALVGKPLELEGHTIDGKPLDLSRYEGRVVLVDFWATWCGPCRAEIPNILQNWEKYHDLGFDVIAISVDQDMNALKTFVAKENPPWVVVADKFPGNKRSMGAKYGIRGIPAFILIGRDGKVAAVNCRGQRLGKQLAQLIGRGGGRPPAGSY